MLQYYSFCLYSKFLMHIIVKRFLVWSFVVFVLAMAGCIYSINVPPWIEWDEHDPRLHGQEVIFTEPMVYFSIDPLVWYGTDDVLIHEVLFTRKNAMNDFRGTFSLKAKEVKSDARFTITKSFWKRKNWWEAAFSGHVHLVVLENENGKEVISSFYNFNKSNRTELFSIMDEGYYKG